MGVKNNPPGAESVVQPSAVSFTKHLDRPRNRMKIIRQVLDGKTDEQLAAEFGVHETSILRFRQRHAAEIEELTERFLAEAGDYLIAAKTTRIADYDEMREAMRTEATAHPVIEEETRYGVKRRPNPAYDTWLRVNSQAALELDQLPRAGVTVNNQNVVIVKTVATTTGKPHPELD